MITPTTSGIGGTAQHVNNLANFLQKNGHRVEILSSENTLSIPIKGLKNPSFMLSSYLKSKFKKKFDIVHAHNIPSGLAMKNSHGKKILTIHGIYSEQIKQIHGKSLYNLSKKLEEKYLRSADMVTVISKDSLEYYSNLGIQAIQIPNGINFSSQNKEKNRKFKKQIIFAGRLSKEKGTDTLIQICKKIPIEIDLVIVGIGPEANKIKKIELEKKNIHYYGLQSHEKTLSLLRGSDLLIQPSLSEGISSTILESMINKIPVISSNIGGNMELIVDNESGFLIEPSNTEEYIKKIYLLLENNELRKKFIDNAFQIVKKYDWNLIGQQYLDLYNQVLNIKS